MTGIAALAEFYSENGRWPKQTAGNADERKVGKLLAQWRTELRSEAISPDLREELDAIDPTWCRDQQWWWEHRAKLIAQFHAEHGYWPSRVSNDDVERPLGAFLHEQRKFNNRGTLRPARKAMFDEMAPGWESPEDLDVLWASHADTLQRLVKSTGIEPSLMVEDDAERKAAQWLSNQRSRHSRGALEAERVARLDEILPGWQRGRRARSLWHQNLDELVAFIAKNRRMPRGGSIGVQPDEARIQKWFTFQQQYLLRGRLSADRIAMLNERIPGWAVGPRTRSMFAAHLDELTDFTAKNQRLPRSVDCSSDLERRLGVWLDRNRTRQRYGVLPEEHAAALDAAAPGWNVQALPGT